jgi:hypothetical protein
MQHAAGPVLSSRTAMPVFSAGGELEGFTRQAPAWRSLTKPSGTVVEPPVICMPISLHHRGQGPKAAQLAIPSPGAMKAAASSASACVPVGGRGRAGIDLDLVELDVEFLGDQRRLHRIGALALVGARGDQRHAFSVNADIGGERRFAGFEIGEQRIVVRLLTA